MNTQMANDIEQPHRRFNPLTGQWVLVSPHRTQRPWQGKQESTPAARPAHDPNCYLCPGNQRAGGQTNPSYDSTFVFDNDYPAILDQSIATESQDLLFRNSPVEGTCRVICFSPRHDLTLPQMSVPVIRGVVDLWADQCDELGKRYRWVQVFENKGAVMGCSNPHPHGQIWASNTVPEIPTSEDFRQDEYSQKTGGNLLMDYASRESELGERVVVETDHWLAVVPYWATWPFETLLMPKRHVTSIPELSDAGRTDLA